MLSCVQLFETLWTIARQALLFMGLSRQEYWSELPFPPPGDLPDPGIEPMSPALVGRFFFLITKPPWKPTMGEAILGSLSVSLHCVYFTP